MRRWPLALLVAPALIALWATAAAAHPLGNFTINHYAGLVVRPEAVAIDYVIDMAEIPAFQERSALDGDADGTLSDSELAAYGAGRCDALRSGLSVRIDGIAKKLAVTAVRATLPAGQAGLNTLRLECEYRAALDRTLDERSHVLEYADTNYAERIGWREITARGEGARLDTSLSSSSASARLTTYPQDRLSTPLDMRAATIRFTTAGATQSDGVGTAEAAPAVAVAPADALAALIGQSDLSLASLAAALLVAFGLGIVHALSPGHGKTVMAAYLVGTRGTRRQALVLGPIIALSHTTGVLVLAVVTLTASSIFGPERLYPYLSTAAGLIVVGIGAVLVLRTFGARAHDHRHTHVHDSAPAEPDGALGWRPLAALGLSGGIVPSASALLLLLGAIHFGKIALGMVLILAFGFGMAATLVGVGLALVGVGRLAERTAIGHARMRRGLSFLPYVTALVVLVLGMGMTAQALAATF